MQKYFATVLFLHCLCLRLLMLGSKSGRATGHKLCFRLSNTFLLPKTMMTEVPRLSDSVTLLDAIHYHCGVLRKTQNIDYLCFNRLSRQRECHILRNRVSCSSQNGCLNRNSHSRTDGKGMLYTAEYFKQLLQVHFRLYWGMIFSLARRGFRF